MSSYFGVIPWPAMVAITIGFALVVGSILYKFGRWVRGKKEDSEESPEPTKEQRTIDKVELSPTGEKPGYQRMYWDLQDQDEVLVKRLIKAHMRKKHIKQYEVAEKAKVSQALITNILASEPERSPIPLLNHNAAQLDAVLRTMGLKIVLVPTRVEKFTPIR